MSPQGVRDACAQVERLVPTVPVLYDELERRAQAAARDGLSSSGGVSGGGTSQPVEAAAVANESDPLRRAVDRVNRNLAKARRLVEECQSIAAGHGVIVRDGRLLAPKDAAVTPKPVDEIWCRSHARFDIFVVHGSKGRRGLCGFCEAFERDDDPKARAIKDLLVAIGEPPWPPRGLLRRHDERRLMDRDYEDTERELRARAASRSRRRKRKR